MEDKLELGQNLEGQIVAFSLVDKGFFAHCNNILEPKHFEDGRTAKVWKFLQLHFSKYNTLPTPEVIHDTFKRLEQETYNQEKLNSIITHFEPENKKWLTDKIIEIVKSQNMKEFILKAARQISKPNPDYDALIEKAKQIILLNPDVDLGTFYFKAKERYAKYMANSENRVSTGFPTVDKYLSGGFAPKELYCWMAPPGIGKSTWLVVIGKNLVMQGLNVVHYSLEMSEERVGLRYDASLLNETTRDLMNNWEAAVARIEMHRKHLKNNLIIKEFPTRTATTNHLRSHLQRLLEYHNFIPDVVIVDYGDIMRSIHRYEKEYAEQGAIFEELRALSQELGIPIITATQTNRDSLEKEVITMKNIGDSFQKARIVDFLAAICQQPEDKELGIQKIFIAKNRNNIDSVLLGFHVDYAKMQIQDDGEVEE